MSRLSKSKSNDFETFSNYNPKLGEIIHESKWFNNLYGIDELIKDESNTCKIRSKLDIPNFFDEDNQTKLGIYKIGQFNNHSLKEIRQLMKEPSKKKNSYYIYNNRTKYRYSTINL